MSFIKKVLLLILPLLIYSFHAMTQQGEKRYDSLWKKVEDLTNNKGLTKSALTEVDKIFQLAKKEKKEAQVIKALLYQMKLRELIEDATEEPGIITSLEKDARSFSDPVSSILNSILAEKYYNYFRQQRYNVYNRTETINFKKEDIDTWSGTDFYKKISGLYLTSIQNKTLLQQTTLEQFEAIITNGNSRKLRPTLYDLLAHRALSYFKNDEFDLNKPAYAFELTDKDLFLPAKAFMKLRINTSDSLSLHHKALLICQELLQFHASDPQPAAFIDADIVRINIVRQFSTMEKKETLYAQALNELFSTYPKEPNAAKAAQMLAQWHIKKAESYEPLNDTANRYEYLEAMKICEAVIKQPMESEGKSGCLILASQISRPSVNLETEKINIPDQPFRTLVKFKNFTRLYFRILSLTPAQKSLFQNRYDDNHWTQLTGIAPVRSWFQALPDTKDFQNHGAEIKIDALPMGSYALLASINEDFSLDKNPLAVQYFYVSNISYVQNGDDYFVLDRDSGKPLADATVQIWNSKYDPDQRKTISVKGDHFRTDINGHFLIKRNKTDQNNFKPEIHFKDDQLFLDDYEYQTYRNIDESAGLTQAQFERAQGNIFFFTDRSIYRPGQTVYFKGIAITKDIKTGTSKIYSNQRSTVTLYNVNDEAVDSLILVSNEFGSFSGMFKLPSNGLTGECYIRPNEIQGQALFSVEEYKRPKFYTDFEKLKSSYKINDSILITGMAKAYAGNNINGATVKFSVIRTPRIIYPWLANKIRYPIFSPTVILNGTTQTDADGKFHINFKAIPDLTVDNKLEPVFDYHITTNVVDLNGETRMGETTVHVAYKSIQLRVALKQGEVLSADSLKNLSIQTLNLNGGFVPTKVSVRIYRLMPPGRLIRERFWSQPDIHLMDQQSYTRLFPYDDYEDELNPEKWAKTETIYERVDTTEADKNFEINVKGLLTGWYAVEVIATDAFNQNVKDVRNVQVYDQKNLPAAMYSWGYQKSSVVEPGDKQVLTIASSAKDLFVIQRTGKNFGSDDMASSDSVNNFKFIHLDNEKKSFEIPVAESDRGGFGMSNFFVKNNRIFEINFIVNVPWTNKELSINYETFRDKTIPGSDEKWKIKISGYKNEKVAAEMMASMYDASLDQFKNHKWSVPEIWPTQYAFDQWNAKNNFTLVYSEMRRLIVKDINSRVTRYDALLIPSKPVQITLRGNIPGIATMATPKQFRAAKLAGSTNSTSALELTEEAKIGYGLTQNIAEQQEDSGQPGIQNASFKARRNFNETAFFLPDLKTDSAGNISFGFTIPEALTKWKFQALAHTRDASFGYSTKDVITQKKLMVQPNAPRFFREGDHMELSTKIVNMTDKEITGTVHLELLNASDMQPVDGQFQNMAANQYFTAEAGNTVVASFNIQVPYQFNNAIVYRFVAKSDSLNVSDGEEAMLPVLTNSMLVTESLPINIQGNATKKLRFEKLLQSGNSETLKQHSLTVEFSSNPAWYAVQALPYLAESSYECSEQTFNRFYANALATKIAHSSPKIKAIFERWQSLATDSKSNAFLSNLEKNTELKSILLEETPWVLEAKSESEQKKNIALLFDMIRMNGMLQASIIKLQQSQLTNGGFSWFSGGADDRFVTQYILTGLGRLKRLTALPESNILENIIRMGVAYLDKRVKEDYDNLVKSKSGLNKNQTGYLQLQYLYMRSFFRETGIPGESFIAVNYFRKQSQQFWLQQNHYMQGMTALALNRSGDHKTAGDILKSLKQNAIVTSDLGMYWKENRGGYFWYQAPVETQSLLIETFSEIGKDDKTVNELKTWLLQQKQTQRWSSTKATADACYALLLQGTDWLAANPNVEIRLGTKTVSSATTQEEAGTGYFKTIIEGSLVKPSMGEITVNVSTPTVRPGIALPTATSWGAVCWQYFENLDKITAASTPLKLSKKLFVEKNSDRGPILEPIADGAAIKVGDKVTVRIELKVDRDLEYVQLKDMRAACMEPVNVLSSYKYQGGLGYYESTKDASTNFFFSWLPKGTYVFEYPLFAIQAGNFSNGVSTIQCMYAPEFSSHSEGVRVNVE